ncbi:peptide-N-glycosidase F-related protein [candidate division CSSED10-310 bacterium]|uniref:Peptide-N-glycosidase F-related protein n=1 Tax=candidate division CSSED10-310 bacterium TaxID=2855610 RepID=A0ABV6YYX6_UNCC1
MRRGILILLPLVLLLFLGTCSETDDDSDSEADQEPIIWYDFSAQAPWYECPEENFPDDATIVTAFDQSYHYYGAENRREILEMVDFPQTNNWSQVGLMLKLECPEGGECDNWDRSGSIQLVLNPADDEQNWEYLEIVRHITPYRVGMCQFIDVTPLASLFVGQQFLNSWIDTWVGPGSPYGEGWRLTVQFVFYPGPSGAADQVINIWGRKNIVVGYIEEDNNVDSQIDPVTVTIPAEAAKVEARLITTGHSFGNTYNCAEFCQMRQDVLVNNELYSVNPWRDDCEDNPVKPQYGTWRYDRNGWCPGAIVVGHIIDVTSALTLGDDNVIDFDIRLANGEEYHNTDPVDLDPYELISLQLYVYQ